MEECQFLQLLYELVIKSQNIEQKQVELDPCNKE